MAPHRPRSWRAAAVAAAVAALGAAPEPGAVERWSHNPRRLTAEGLAALKDGRGEPATAAFDAAARLARGGASAARTRINAGAAHLLAGDAEGALEWLDDPALTGDLDLGSEALYDLGTARLAAGDLEGAAEALRETLRRDPGLAPAKHNLELALRRLAQAREEQQRQQQQQQQQQEQGQPEAEQAPESQGERSGEGAPPPNPGQPSGAPPAPGEGNPPPSAKPSPGEGRGAPRDPRLPQFHDQPEMSAQQAAALLEAVENLERNLRRQEAERRAARRATEEKDW